MSIVKHAVSALAGIALGGASAYLFATLTKNSKKRSTTKKGEPPTKPSEGVFPFKKYAEVAQVVEFSPEWRSPNLEFSAAGTAKLDTVSVARDEDGFALLLIPTPVGNLVLFEDQGSVYCDAPYELEMLTGEVTGAKTTAMESWAANITVNRKIFATEVYLTHLAETTVIRQDFHFRRLDKLKKRAVQA